MSGLAQIRGMDKLIRRLHATPAQVKKVGDDLVRKNARTLISSSGKIPGLVQITPPHGGADGQTRGVEARKTGEAAVARDIRSVYVTVQGLYPLIRSYGGPELAAQFWAILKNKPERVKRWLEQSAPDAVRAMKRGWDGGDEHMRRRDKRGRVRGQKPSVVLLPGQEKELAAYIKHRQANVGMLAASIPAAYNGRFGPLKGVPAWVKRHLHSWAGGTVSERTTSLGLRVRVTVNAGNLNSEMQRRFNYVLGYRLKAMEREAPFALRGFMKSLQL